MHAHLEIAVWPHEGPAALGDVETAVIRAWMPPLNLSKVDTAPARIKAARRVMADQAPVWAREGDRAPEMPPEQPTSAPGNLAQNNGICPSSSSSGRSCNEDVAGSTPVTGSLQI
jgi:hypothetical protein